MISKTKTQAALDRFTGLVVKARFNAPGRDAEDVMQEIAEGFAILIADLNDAKSSENDIPSTRDIERISGYLRDTVSEAFSDTNTYIENARVYGERTHLRVVS